MPSLPCARNEDSEGSTVSTLWVITLVQGSPMTRPLGGYRGVSRGYRGGGGGKTSKKNRKNSI